MSLLAYQDKTRWTAASSTYSIRGMYSIATYDVLIVEDDSGIREMITEALTDEGYAVRSAHHGKEALELLKNHTPRLILLDVMMPVMDGNALSQALQADPHYRSIPVIMMSAAHNLEAFRNATHVVGLLPKPFVLTTLLDLVEQKIA